MAEPGRTVRVSGLPTDIEDDRLKDKLFIHFLRSRNGGGEIDYVTILKAKQPNSALITFEDSGVAQRVIQHSRHILEVDGKKYELTVSEHHKSPDPDKVIVSLSAAVDYSQLPGGKVALTSVQKSHPDVQANYDATKKLCILHGSYTKVSSALTQLLSNPRSAERKGSGQLVNSGSGSVQTVQSAHSRDSHDQRRKRKEKRETPQTCRPSNESSSSSHKDVTHAGNDWDSAGQLERAGASPVLEEDYSLMMDADMFQYLQKCCREEYQHILSQYDVEVVDVTNQDLTTLFLHVATAAGEGGQEQERIKLARAAISKLHQENETKICQAQLYKSILSARGGLQRAMETLNLKFPKLLLNEDDTSLYIIGSQPDVSEAKQFLLLQHGGVKKKDVTSLLRLPSFDLGSSAPAAVEERREERDPFSVSAVTARPLDDKTHQTMQSGEDERTEGGTKYKLATRLKDLRMCASSSRPGDFSLPGFSSPGRQTRPGPMLVQDTCPEIAEIGGERVSRAVTQNTEGETLLKSDDDLHSLPSKNPFNAGLMDIPPRGTKSIFSTVQLGISGSVSLPPAEYGSSLMRTSSFSGMHQRKAQETGQRTQDDSRIPSVRAKSSSSSFSHQKARERQDVYNAEMTVSIFTWHHIKDSYSSRLEDLTTDVQIKERSSQSSNDLTIIIRGADQSKVKACQQGLQNLFDTVSADFSLQEIRLSELGVSDPADEMLQSCCAEVRSQFKKITIQMLKKSLLLFGPKQLCSQVNTFLREVFSVDSVLTPEQQNFLNPSTSSWNPSARLQLNEDQSTSAHCNSNSLAMLESRTGRSQVGRTNLKGDSHEVDVDNGSMSQKSMRRDPVMKEKVEWAMEMDGLKAFANPFTQGNNEKARHVNGVASTHKERSKPSVQKESLQQRQVDVQDTAQDSRSGQGNPGCICVCGKTETSMKRTDCGAIMCSKCLDTVHVHCRVCHRTELTPQGIQGKMSHSKLNISVPGYHKDPAIKITYCIPDGIQGEGHPSPGKPFQGAVFEAYLPDCEKSRKLLPRLEKAFKQGLTFTVMSNEKGAKVTWDGIPHKTSLQGGKSGSGYPDSTYLNRLSDILTSYGIEK